MLTEIEPSLPPPKDPDEYYRYLVDSISNYAIFMLDKDGKVLTWNEGARLCQGYEKEEVLGKHFCLFYTPEDILTGRCQATLDRAAATGRFEEEAWLLRHDGSKFWASITISKLTNKTGEHIGFSLVLRDFSVRRHLEDELRRSQNRFEILTAGTKEGVFEHDLQTGDLYTSPTCRQLLGFPDDQPLSWIEWTRQVRSEDLVEVLKKRQAYINQEIPDYSVEFRYTLPATGEERWIAAKIHVTRDESGKAVSLIGSISDITIKRNAEEALRRSEAKLRELMLLVPVGIFQTNEEGHYTYVNEHWSQITGRSPDSALGSGWLDSVHPEDRDRVTEEWRKAITQRLPLDTSYRYLRPDGTEGWIIGNSIPLVFKKDLGSGYLGVIQDITALKTAEQNLIQSAKMSSLGQMAGGIAHEINNPLTILQARIEQIKMRLAKGGIEPRDLPPDLDKLRETTNRIAKIVHGLRTFSREGSKDPFSLIKISSIIDDTLELCRDKIKQKSISVHLNLNADGNLECRPSQISQVLVNILLNAFDAVENLDEKWVELTTTNLGESLEISVTDSGTGISEEVQEKMMIPFFTTKDVGKGTGLGLSISKGIIDDHHGNLYYDDSGPHTRFVIELPWHQPQDENIPT